MPMTRLRCLIRLLLDYSEPAHTAIRLISGCQRISDKRSPGRTVRSDISSIRRQVEAHILAARRCGGGDHLTTGVKDHAARPLSFASGQPDAIHDGGRLLRPIEGYGQDADDCPLDPLL